MRSRTWFTAVALSLALGLHLPARAEEHAARPAAAAGQERAMPAAAGPAADEVEALRREIQELREQIRLLRDQVAALTAGAPGPAPGAAAPPAAAPQEAAPPAAAAPARSQSLLNPAISAVFQAIGATSLTRENDEVNGFDLSEAELAFQSVVDPYARVDLFLSFPAGETPEVEEGAVTTLGLPKSVQLKGGRFKSAFGKWNALHNHAFFSVDRPDALTNFFGDESLTDDGLSLSFLVPNPWNLYIESVTEVGTPRPGESFNIERRSLLYLEHLSWFFNTSPDATLEVGLSAARGRTGPSTFLAAALADCGGTCSSLRPRDELDSAVEGVDLTYKWKPLRLNVYKSFLWQTELLRSRRDVDVLDAAAPALAPKSVSSLGAYSYVEWQPRKRWKIGARYDLSGFPDDRTAREWAGSAVVRFRPSEFQEIRFQLKRTVRNAAAAARFGDDDRDNQIFFAWIPAIGAHGAHKY
jgi:hypothetical protein